MTSLLTQTRTFSGVCNGGRLPQASYQPQPLQTRMPVLADDDVIVHRDAERRCDVDDRRGHLNIGLRRCRIAGGMIVQDALETTYRIERLTRTSRANSDRGRQQGAVIGDCSRSSRQQALRHGRSFWSTPAHLHFRVCLGDHSGHRRTHVCCRRCAYISEMTVSFDHLVCAGEQRRRDREPERLCGLRVDKSNLLGCFTVKSPGFSPLRMRPA
jgi:hypothetical protein